MRPAAAAILPPGARGKGLLERASMPLRRRYIGTGHAFDADQVDLLAGPGRKSAFDITDPVYDQAAEAGLDDVCAMQLVDINTWLAGDVLVRVDRMTAAHGLHPSRARALIRETAEKAVAGAAAGAPPPLASATLEVSVRTTDLAEAASWVRGVDRAGPRELRIRGRDALETYRCFCAPILLTRTVAEIV